MDAPVQWYQSDRRLIRTWIYFSICVAITHGCETTCVALATAILGSRLGATSTGILFLSYAISALVGSTWLTNRFGPKWSVFLSLMVLVIYVGAFLIAAFAEAAAWPASIIGGFVGGIASAWLWTAQGAYFARISACAAVLLLKKDKKSEANLGSTSKMTTSRAKAADNLPMADDFKDPKLDRQDSKANWINNQKSDGSTSEKSFSEYENEANSNMSGVFGGIYVFSEVILKLFASVFIRVGGVQTLFAVYTVVAFAAALATYWLPQPPPFLKDVSENDEEKTNDSRLGHKSHALYLLIAATRLFYNNITLRYLTLFQILFGLALTFADFQLSGVIVPESLGVENVGWLTAIIPLAATMVSYPLVLSGQTLIGKRSGLVLGGVVFGVVGILACAITQQQLESFGWGIVIFFILMGIGRGVYETTNKAALVDFFPGEAATPAFANNYAWSGIAFAIAFFAYEGMSQTAMGVVIILGSIFSIFGSFRAYALWKASESPSAKKSLSILRKGEEMKAEDNEIVHEKVDENSLEIGSVAMDHI